MSRRVGMVEDGGGQTEEHRALRSCVAVQVVGQSQAGALGWCRPVVGRETGSPASREQKGQDVCLCGRCGLFYEYSPNQKQV